MIPGAVFSQFQASSLSQFLGGEILFGSGAIIIGVLDAIPGIGATFGVI